MWCGCKCWFKSIDRHFSACVVTLPVAIALIAQLARSFLPNPGVHTLGLGCALSFALLDALKVAGIDMSFFDFLPLFDLYGVVAQ